MQQDCVVVGASFAGLACATALAGAGARVSVLRAKRFVRFLFDHLQSDLACNLLLGTAPVRAAASLVYFHRRAVFEDPRPAVRPATGGLVTRLLPPRD